MKFTKYNSIENTYREEFINQIKFNGYGKEVYHVQEKIHGSNFSILTDGVEVKCAKRTGPVEDGENFYNAVEVVARYQEKVLSLFEYVKNKRQIHSLTVFGELFGGFYNHEEVEKVKGAIKVQKGIEYCPENDFYVFDILINDEEYLTVLESNELFEKFDFFYSKSLFVGSLDEAIQYPNEFQSTIPNLKGLPLIENNSCEGVVIRPEKALFFKGGSRVILKNKNEKWSEKAHRKSNAIKKVEFTEVGQKVFAELVTYNTENRLNNVISKLGEVTIKQFGQVLGMMSQDILTDFEKDFPNQLSDLQKEERKQINKELNKEVTQLIRPILLRM